MKQQSHGLYERLDQMEQAQQVNPENRGGDRRRRRENDGEQRTLRIDGIKLNIPTFNGKSDPDAYLEWEIKVEHEFACNEYNEVQKMKLAAAEFSHYALTWWNKYQRDRTRYEEPMVESWTEMKRIMRKRYIPASYNRELQLKLQRMTQGNKSVEEYFKEMEVTMIRAGKNEENEAIMARFLNGLNHDIRDVVELQEYVDMKELLHKANQVEQQLKRKGIMRSSNNNKNFNWKDKAMKDKGVPSSSVTFSSGKSPHRYSNSPPKRKTSEVKCFKCLGRGHYASECPTKKNMISLSKTQIVSEPSSEEEKEEVEVELDTLEGDLLMIRRLMGSKMQALDQTQRENIFHTRCSIQGKICSLIVDGGSCTNVASSRLVTKLNLETKPHPRPYKLQWLSEDGEMTGSKQVGVNLSIGQYNDNVLCDVVPMEATHILLGRPWQFDTKAIHDGFTNKISFMQNNKKIILKPLSPREVCEDQIKLREKRVQEKREMSETPKQSKSETLTKRETHERKMSGLLKVNEVKKLLLSSKPLYLPYCTNNTLVDDLSNQINFLPSVDSVLQEIQTQVEELMNTGWVQETMSPCVVPVILVPKNDGYWRMCTDYRALNNITIKYKHHIPRLDDLMDELYGGCIFSKIDLKSGCHEIRIRNENEWKTVFTSKYGLYDWRELLFGLTNASSTFMRLMNYVLREFLGKFVVVYFDDILIYNTSLELHKEHLCAVLNVLRKEKLYANLDKCRFCTEQIAFLCFVVSAKGVHVDYEKVMAIQELCLHHVEFAYNMVVDSTSNCDPFEILYGLNPLTPIYLLTMPNIFVLKHKDTQAKIDYVRKQHKKVEEQVEEKGEGYSKQVNKGRKKVIFDPGDGVWVHMRKEMLTRQRKSKLQSRRDGPFQVLEMINDNAYKIDLSSTYNMSSTFNVSDLSHFIGGDEALDLTSSLFQEGGNDVDIQAQGPRTTRLEY
ncbi:uncharacterized protein [Phaseolus vulgaris]|uniref:uncharacterized protein n=1 Tax=Phaseolus vulgaris TaxID=3885 RepID=UPI0035CB096E